MNKMHKYISTTLYKYSLMSTTVYNINTTTKRFIDNASIRTHT